MCVAGVVEGDARCVETYLSGGGDPARALTHAEVALLNRASAFDAGHTLVHLAIRYPPLRTRHASNIIYFITYIACPDSSGKRFYRHYCHGYQAAGLASRDLLPISVSRL